MSQIFNQVNKIPKPWGYELWFALTKDYAGKVIYIEKDQRLSLQYHKQKQESMLLWSGKISLLHGEKPGDLCEVIVSEGQAFTLNPGVIHRVKALENSTIIEVSTSEMDDVIRIEDDFGRI